MPDAASQTHASGAAPDPRRAAYDALTRLGTLRYAAVDLCDLEQLRQVVAQAASDWQCSLDGVIHLAGTAPERSLSAETRNSLAATLTPKVLGTWTLHQLVKQNPDSLFISFSSLASYFGGAMVGAYAAANTFLNHFAHQQRYGDGLQSYCFAWGLWDGIGMSRNSLAKDLLKLKGYLSVTAQQGLSSLLAGLHHHQGSLLVGLEGDNRNIQRYTADVIPTQSLAAYYVLQAEPLTAAALARLSVRDRLGTPTRCRFYALAALPLTETQEIDRVQLSAWSGNPAAVQVKPTNAIETP